MTPWRFSTFISCARSLACAGMCLLPGSLNAVIRYDGLGTVTTIEGAVRHQNEVGQGGDLKLHQCLSLDHVGLKSTDQGLVILSLSNNLSIGLEPSTELQFVTFQQTSFPEEKASLEDEPSTSLLSFELKEGQLALYTPHISPLSKIELRIPQGRLNVQACKALIRVKDSTTTVSVVDGSLTFEASNGEYRRYLTAPTEAIIRITNGSIEIEEPSEPTKSDFLQSVENANTRVFYTGDNLQLGTQPKLVRDPDFRSKTKARPLTYLEPQSAASK